MQLDILKHLQTLQNSWQTYALQATSKIFCAEAAALGSVNRLIRHLSQSDWDGDIIPR
jgi:hypothetical protein